MKVVVVFSCTISNKTIKQDKRYQNVKQDE